MAVDLAAALRAAALASDEAKRAHSDALLWMTGAPGTCAVAWLPKGWASETGAEHFSSLVSARTAGRIREILKAGQQGLQHRAHRIMDERAAMQVAIRGILSSLGDFPRQCPASDLFVRYTRLGQPMPGWRGEAAEWAIRNGVRQRDVHISFTHDGEAVIALAAMGDGLRGVGVDVVRLDRLRRRGREYLNRFCRHFMSEGEYARFLSESLEDLEEGMVRRVAAHFSLMESASKALGTGLKIGGGMGKPESMKKQSINVNQLSPSVILDLAPEVRVRMGKLHASSLAGYYSADSEYLVSAAYLRS